MDWFLDAATPAHKFALMAAAIALFAVVLAALLFGADLLRRPSGISRASPPAIHCWSRTATSGIWCGSLNSLSRVGLCSPRRSGPSPSCTRGSP